MTSNDTTDTTLAQARQRFLLVGAWVPLVMLAVAVALQVMWLPQLPDPVATHFSGSGPDGFGPAITYPLMTVGVGALFLAITVFGVLAPAKSTGWGATARFMGAFMPAMLLMILIGTTWSVHSQRGLSDAMLAPDPGLFLLIGAGVGLVYGSIAWFVQPALTIAPADMREASARTIVAGERAAWMRTLRVQGAGLWVMVAALVVMISSAIVTTLTGSSAAWWLWTLAVLIAVLFATMFVFRVRIDDSGFTARSILGFPVFRIPLAEIAAARTLTVSPLADFGGWGLRLAPGMGFGIILQAGSALQIERTNGKRLTITIDDAERAADVLLGLRDRTTP